MSEVDTSPPAVAAAVRDRPGWRRARVAAVRDVAVGVRRVELDLPAGTPRADPGSHLDVQVRLADGRAETRSYSVVEGSSDGRRVALSVLLSPRSRGGSAHVHTLAVGDEVACTGPLQNFPLRVGAERYLLVAGGVGVTALVAAARTLARLGADVEFVYAGRRRDRMPYVAELTEALGDRLDLRVTEEGNPLDVAELVGRTAEQHPGTEAYVCGPLRLMDAVRRRWDAAGLPPTALRFETFGNSGWYDPEEFTVRIPEVGLETVVDPGSTLLEAVQRAGGNLMYDCLKGECGLCRLEVADVRGRVDHRDVFLSQRQQARDDAVCVCVSRVVRDGADGPPPVLVLRMP